MLDFFFNRRDLLRVGSIGAGMTTLGLSDYSFSQDGAAAYKDKTVVWLWLAGGPAQFETFHAPLDNVPSELTRAEVSQFLRFFFIPP